jgi:predicted Fe-Mo cluster-binding NifX family protein
MRCYISKDEVAKGDQMKIAIPAFRTKVSPRFDTAQEFILVEIAGGHITDRKRLPVKNSPVSEKIRDLMERDVDTLICGGIDRLSMRQLRFNHIEIYAWVTGEVEDAVTCFLRNELNPGIILGKNGKREGRWRFRRKNCIGDALQKGNHPGTREVNIMPTGDGTGPQGQGPGTGQGRGNCKSQRGAGGSGGGRGRRQGKGRGGKANSGRGRGMRSGNAGKTR